MNIQKITTALTGSAVAAGIFIGGLAVSTPAQAATAVQSGTVCSVVATPSVRANASNLNPLTRPAQVNAAEPVAQAPVASTPC